jgi:hypothetical protein
MKSLGAQDFDKLVLTLYIEPGNGRDAKDFVLKAHHA